MLWKHCENLTRITNIFWSLFSLKREDKTFWVIEPVNSCFSLITPAIVAAFTPAELFPFPDNASRIKVANQSPEARNTRIKHLGESDVLCIPHSDHSKKRFIYRNTAFKSDSKNLFFIILSSRPIRSCCPNAPNGGVVLRLDILIDQRFE